MKRAAPLWLRRRAERGQAMLEYSAITYFLMLAGGTSFLFVMPEMMNAMDTYLKGIYYVLNLAIP